MTKRVLEGFGIRVYAAYSVPEAEQIVRSTRLDLAICDFDMPRRRADLLQPASRWRGISVGLMPRPAGPSSHKRIQLRVPKPVSADMLVAA